MRALAVVVGLLTACDPGPPPEPQYPNNGYPQPQYGNPYQQPYEVPPPSGGGGGGGGYHYADPQQPTVDFGEIGKLDSTLVDFEFDGGRLEFELRREGTHVYQVARNRYMVPVVIAWTISQLDNVSPMRGTTGVAYLPAASQPMGKGPAVLLTELGVVNPTLAYRRNLSFTARFGDPRAEPTPYAYAFPYAQGQAFNILQGFHGAFSHRGSNEYAVDFDCPVATTVRAAREGIVVAANARAQGSGTTREFLEYKRVNFVLVLHDDGTLGEYMHLSPSGVSVHPGQKIGRNGKIGLSGNTGYSSTPHLHFQVMTAADDGNAARSFPFQFSIGMDRVVTPIQGKSYLAWE